MQHQLFIDGQWVGGGPPLEVTNKYTGERFASLAQARREEVEAALAAAARGAAVMADMPAYRRYEILSRTAALIGERREEFARTIATEAGKALKFARIEVDRAIGTFTFAAEEAKRLHGEVLPLDAIPSGQGYFGYYVRRPVGVVVGITPFNFPLNLVAHKVAPALAAGNAMILKPASWTPVTSVLLCQALSDAGLPPGALNLIVGPGGTIGEQLVTDRRVAKVTLTGSVSVGRQILAMAGVKKVTLELGNTGPVIVAPDADLEYAARRCAVGAYYNSGQVCISVQRIYVERPAYAAFLEAFIGATRAMVVGDPLDEQVDVGPMIDEKEARRIESWVAEATAAGANVATGGTRQGAVYVPTVLTDVTPDMKVVAEELFGPVASVIACDDFDDGLRQADDTDYGLQAAVFTRDLERVFRAVRRLNFGGVIVNDSPAFRGDHMPYGGTRQSGLGREGVRFAMEEMTNIQMVAIRSSW